MKNVRFFLYENSQFLVVKFSVHSNRHVFVMIWSCNRIKFRTSKTGWDSSQPQLSVYLPFQGESSSVAVFLCSCICGYICGVLSLLFLIPYSFRISGRQYLVIVTFPRYLYLYFKYGMASSKLLDNYLFYYFTFFQCIGRAYILMYVTASAWNTSKYDARSDS